jgi:hypothetical protein
MRIAVALVASTACGRVDFAARSDASTTDASGDATVTAGLLGWWKLDDGSAKTAADSSGRGNPGTLSVDFGWGTGPRGGVLVIPDGVDNEQVDLGDPVLFHLTGSMSVTGWANLSSINPNAFDDVILSRDNFNGGDSGWSLKGSEDCGLEAFAFQITNVSIVERCSATGPALDTWYHVAGVYDAAAQTLDIYVDGMLNNGMLRGTVPNTQHPPMTPVHAQIGNADPNSSTIGGHHVFHGMLSDVRIYDRALSASEVAQLASP